MRKKTMLRDATLEWIERLAKGVRFTYQDAYKYLEENFPSDCNQSGFQKRGNQRVPAYWRYAGFAIWDARLRHGLIKHTGIRGQRERI